MTSPNGAEPTHIGMQVKLRSSPTSQYFSFLELPGLLRGRCLVLAAKLGREKSSRCLNNWACQQHLHGHG